MEELKEGMYVRTNEGYIAKYNKSKHNCSGKYYGFDFQIRDNSFSEYDDDCFLWESELDTIIKTSHNLIDLIEVGDVIAIKEDIDRFAQVFILGIYEPALLKEIKTKLESGKLILDRILTKEQFEREAYKL